MLVILKESSHIPKNFDAPENGIKSWEVVITADMLSMHLLPMVGDFRRNKSGSINTKKYRLKKKKKKKSYPLV